MNIVTESFAGKQISASANVCPAPGALAGIFCSSGSATVTIYDDAGSGTSTKLVDTFTPSPGTFTPLPFEFKNGLNVVISGAGSYTVGFRQL
jgi:hypothetical protein